MDRCCPTCGLPGPQFHPLGKGKVDICIDDYHLQLTEENTPAKIARVQARREWLRDNPPQPVIAPTMPRRPWEIDPKGHVWQKNDDGTTDTIAMDSDSGHNGPRCVNCGESFCEHCFEVGRETFTRCLFREWDIVRQRSREGDARDAALMLVAQTFRLSPLVRFRGQRVLVRGLSWAMVDRMLRGVSLE